MTSALAEYDGGAPGFHRAFSRDAPGANSIFDPSLELVAWGGGHVEEWADT
jgi:hypothetical protein